MNLGHQYLVDLSAALSMFVIIVIFLFLFEPRCSKKVYYGTLIPFLAVYYAVNLYTLFGLGIEVHGRYTLLTATLPSLIYFFIMAKNRGGRFFFTFCLVDTVMIWMMMVTGLLDYAVGSDGLVNFALRIAAFPVMMYAAWRFARKPYLALLHTVSRGWWLFAGMTGLFYITMSVMAGIPTNLRLRPEDMPAMVMVLILLPLTYATIFTVLYQQDRLFRVREQQRTFEVQSAMIERRAEEIQEAEERIRIERHDLRHRLQAIAVMTRQDDKQGVLDYIGTAQAALDEAAVRHYCTDPFLDAVLSSYFRRAEEMGIRVEVRLELPEVLPVSAAELSTVFANALENMILAVQQLPPEQRRMVCRCVSSPSLIMEFSNPCGPETRIGADGLPVARDSGHGIGTRSIMAFAEKYKALCVFQAEDGWFRLRLAL